ncbi:hypothetical protein NVV95_01285 [Herbiconiux sp. CPCC 205716]|uniref:Glycosyl hydrolase-like 10 domain-containing protein n=1 Tax=Herbiconiux gentiana TaxID=2970912 RepID=A0ABT2GBZ4_9MICO|nr:hypothetical protein [Herbiconiux gentiana]MCS5713177.1 hypothetical protein [Herbiconiux gentiana]
MTDSPIIGVKCYGFEWNTRYGLSEVQAADRLRSHGVDWVILQNRRDPVPTSDVEQVLPSADAYDDHRFRDALRERGIRTFETSAVYFRPSENAAHPDLNPRDADDEPMVPYDWYLGVSPHSQDYLERRIAVMSEVVGDLQPDGLFLNFIRFPGFWESWTRVVERSEIPEYSFAPDAVRRFEAETGHDLGEGPAARRNRTLQHELRAEWTAWKCSVVERNVQAIKDAAERVRPGTEILINGLAFPLADRGDVAREICGQDLGALSGIAEHIETMVYHQILGYEPDPWVERVLADLRPRVQGTLLASLQTTATYTAPPHLGLGRRSDLPPTEVRDALAAVARSGADGVSMYHWVDILADELMADGVMARALRDYKAGELR